MNRRAPAGPAGTARWEERTLGDGQTRPTTVLRLPDAGAVAGERRLYYILPKTPQLLRDSSGAPALSLTLVTSRQPRPDDALDALVTQGRLEATFTLAVPPAALAALAALDDGDYQPLFARAIDLLLEADGLDGANGVTLASAAGSGAGASIALSAPLDRAQALGALAALDGAPSGLRLVADARYRVAATPRTVRLTGSAVAIYDDLQAHADAERTLTRGALASRFTAMLQTGVLAADLIASDGTAAPLLDGNSEALFDAFMRVAALLVDRVTPELPLADPGNRYALRGRPSPLLALNLTQTLSAADDGATRLSASLEEALGGALDGHDWSRFVHLVSPSGTTDSGYAPTPRLVSASRSRAGGPENRAIAVAARDNAVTSLALAMTPATTAEPSAHALLASDAHGAAVAANWAAQDLVLVIDDGPRVRHLPVVANRADQLWPDRVEKGVFWYAPTFTLLQPEPNQAPADSPFLFAFSQTGVTAGPNPTPGLDGSVRFTLRQGPSQATTDALAARGNPTAKPVPLGGLSVALQLPFRDQASGETRMQSFPAQVEQRGDTLVVTVDLLNEWVRLCYGALAYPGFQAQPPSLSVAYGFRAYVPYFSDDIRLHYGGKIALLQVAATKLDLPRVIDKPIFNAGDQTLQLPSGELRYVAEAPRPRAAPPSRRPALAATAVATAVLAQPAALATTVAQPSVLVARPELEIAPAVADIIAKVKYATQTILHAEAPEALMVCATFGGFYVQQTGDTQTAIGCQDALRLGEISYRQYEEIPELRDDRLRVFRSLQQPGRFLVAPAAYRITRYGPDEPAERAYRPIILVYATLDPDPARNRYFFRATLQADIPDFMRRDLVDRLAPYAPFGHPPQLDYPTEPFVQTTTTYHWSLPDGIAEPDVQQMWDGFQVALSTDLANAALVMTLLENDGVTGQATFTLPDGLALTSSLTLDSNVIGPWDMGPVEVAVTSGTATLTNRVEHAVNVFELLTRGASGPTQHTRVDATLPTGGATQVAVAGASDAAWVSYAVVPQQLTLRELDIFAEDVVSNVLFVNLVNYANHNLRQLALRVRVKGAEHIDDVAIDEGQTASLTLTLPLTTYLESQVIQFQAVKTLTTDAQPSTTDWLDWNLATQGISISLVWELIQ